VEKEFSCGESGSEVSVDSCHLAKVMAFVDVEHMGRISRSQPAAPVSWDDCRLLNLRISLVLKS
jgi:hypothetical protein